MEKYFWLTQERRKYMFRFVKSDEFSKDLTESALFDGCRELQRRGSHIKPDSYAQ